MAIAELLTVTLGAPTSTNAWMNMDSSLVLASQSSMLFLKPVRLLIRPSQCGTAGCVNWDHCAVTGDKQRGGPQAWRAARFFEDERSGRIG